MGTTEHSATLPERQSNDTGLPGKGGNDGFGGFGRTFLSDAVGRGQVNKPDDVLKASTFLAENKLLPQATEKADEGFFQAVENGQRRLNDLAGGGLQIDGIAKPWGPTEVLSQRAVSSNLMRPPTDNHPTDSLLPAYPDIGGPPDENFKVNTYDDFWQKFDLFLRKFRSDEIPFMGKIPTGGVSPRKRG